MMFSSSFSGPGPGVSGGLKPFWAPAPLKWTLQDAACAMQATLVGACTQRSGGALQEPVFFTGASVGTDSRSLPQGGLFVALHGAQWDGHRFVQEAVSAGAQAVVVETQAEAAGLGVSVPRLVVPDTFKALGDLAAWVRKKHPQPLVGITGSNGKTTTKEMVAAVLSGHGCVHKTTGNLNNHVGLPLTLLAWPETAWACVAEMGMSAAGEIARLTNIALPDVGLITGVGPAHLEGDGLGSLEAIARAKAELLAGLPQDSVAVLNADDRLLMAVGPAFLGSQRLLTFGSGPGCDVRIRQCICQGLQTQVVLEIDSYPLEVCLPLVGRHHASNAAGAAAVAWALGCTPQQIAEGLARVAVPGSRLRIFYQAGLDVHLVDDTYSANPASMQVAFQALQDVAGSHRKLAVLGDMLELGAEAAALHGEVGAAAAASGIQRIFTWGPCAAATADGACQAGGSAQAYTDWEALTEAVRQALRAGDWLLVKGSRGMRMERMVAYLREGGA